MSNQFGAITSQQHEGDFTLDHNSFHPSLMTRPRHLASTPPAVESQKNSMDFFKGCSCAEYTLRQCPQSPPTVFLTKSTADGQQRKSEFDTEATHLNHLNVTVYLLGGGGNKIKYRAGGKCPSRFLGVREELWVMMNFYVLNSKAISTISTSKNIYSRNIFLCKDRTIFLWIYPYCSTALFLKLAPHTDDPELDMWLQGKWMVQHPQCVNQSLQGESFQFPLAQIISI